MSNVLEVRSYKVNDFLLKMKLKSKKPTTQLKRKSNEIVQAIRDEKGKKIKDLFEERPRKKEGRKETVEDK